jgi:hypothetical protein
MDHEQKYEPNDVLERVIAVVLFVAFPAYKITRVSLSSRVRGQ